MPTVEREIQSLIEANKRLRKENMNLSMFSVSMTVLTIAAALLFLFK